MSCRYLDERLWLKVFDTYTDYDTVGVHMDTPAAMKLPFNPHVSFEVRTVGIGDGIAGLDAIVDFESSLKVGADIPMYYVE